jgi:ribose 5-phosphate isomerase RpiB
LPALGLITVNPTANVENFLAAMRNEGLAAQSFNHADCWMRNLESLCDALAGGEVKLGAIVAPYAADAMLLAGKCKGVRAVQGSSVAAVAAAVRHYDANLLVIEHAVSTFHEMRQMVRTFTAPRQAPANTALMERVAKKEGRP